jgi:nucleotide-binding universal stress UspA family protein
VVTILHVIPQSLTPGQQAAAERDAVRALAVEARHLRKSLPHGVSVHPIVVRGAPVKEIAACATKVHAELIIMGRGGARAVREAFLGSTAERVIRRAKLPVLVVRLAPRSAYARPALAVDLDGAGHDVVRGLLRLLPPPRPVVVAIHAYEVPYAGMVYPSLANDDVEEENEVLQRNATWKLERLLRLAVSHSNVSPGDAPVWKTHVREGSPSLLVAKRVRAGRHDLLVLGTRGYAVAAHLFLGTVSGELLREVKCDVLVIPPKAAAGRSTPTHGKKQSTLQPKPA